MFLSLYYVLVYTIYSLMGGNVVRGEGVFAADSIQVDNIDTSGVLDGYLNGMPSLQFTLSDSCVTRNFHFGKFAKYLDGVSDNKKKKRGL